MRTTAGRHVFALCAAIAFAISPCARAADCTRTSTGLVPIPDLGSSLYLGEYAGGLYPGGNQVPADHRSAGLARAASVTPLDASGQPDPNGKVVMLSIGMSNTDMEWCFFNGFRCAAVSFTGQALAHPDVDHETLAIANGASGGQTARAWTDPDAPNYTRVLDEELTPAGLTPAQVQVAWVKLANGVPNRHLPDPAADAFELEGHIATVARSLRINYPNLALVFVSSRIYAGYASTNLNPEPYAYESGFSVKWLIEAQIRQHRGLGVDPIAGDLDYTTGVAPWIAWGPYLWADGTTPNGDGLTWSCSDLASDGTHPAGPGREKVGGLLLDFFLGSEFAAGWFRAPEPAGLLSDLAGVAALFALAGGSARRAQAAAAAPGRAAGAAGFDSSSTPSSIGPKRSAFRSAK